MISIVDCAIFQSIASCAAPAVTIYTVVNFTKKSIEAVKALRRIAIVSAYGPTVVGLGCIPLIIRPIDRSTNALLDYTFRMVFPK